jgi:hypothetical protein
MILHALLEAKGLSAPVEEIQGVLAGLLDVEGAPVEFEAYADLLVDNGFNSLLKLRAVTEARLWTLGISKGDAAVMMGLIGQQAQGGASQDGPGLAGPSAHGGQGAVAPVRHPHMGKVEVKTFPVLTATGYPDRPGWQSWIPKLVTIVESSMGQDWADLVQQAASTGVAPALTPAAITDIPALTAAREIWRIFSNAGPQGMPDSLMKLLSKEAREGRDGMKALVEVASKVYAKGDSTVGLLHEWLQKPPKMGEATKHTAQKGLTDWKGKIQRCDDLNEPYGSVGKRLSLKKMFTSLPEIKTAWAIMTEVKKGDPEVEDLIDMIERITSQYATEWNDSHAENSAYSVNETEADDAIYGAQAEGGKCHFWELGTCKKGATCKYMHGEEVHIPKPRPKEEAQAMQAMVAAEVDRRIKSECTTRGLNEHELLCLMQGGKQKVKVKGNEKAMAVIGVVADTGATIRAIGRKHVDLLQNKRKLKKSLIVNAAGGRLVLKEGGDLPMKEGMMDDGVILPDGEDSLLPVIVTCEEKNMGFQVSQGGDRARFYRDGATVQELVKEGRLFTVPVLQDDGFQDCDDGFWLTEGLGDSEGFADCEEGEYAEWDETGVNDLTCLLCSEVAETEHSGILEGQLLGLTRREA